MIGNYFCGLFAVVKNWCKSEDTRDIKIQKYILLLPCFEWEIRGIICGTKNVGECKGCHEKKSFSSKINQTLQKASMDKNSSLFKWSACQIQGEMIVKKQKYIEDIKNPEPLCQYQSNMGQSILGKDDSSLFKWMSIPFSKWRL